MRLSEPTSLTRETKRARAQLRKLLRSPDRDAVAQGCALLESLASDPEMRPVIEELAGGCGVDGEGHLTFGEEVKRRTRAAHRSLVGIWATRLAGHLDGAHKLVLDRCDVQEYAGALDRPQQGATICTCPPGSSSPSPSAPRWSS